jgi:ABC-type transporter Mla MlaB component
VSDPLGRVEVQEAAGGALVLTVHGEIDSSNAGDLERRIAATIAAGRSVTLDLGPVRYIDSQGVRLVLRVAPPGGAAADLLGLTGLGDLVEVVGSIDDPGPA